MTLTPQQQSRFDIFTRFLQHGGVSGSVSEALTLELLNPKPREAVWRPYIFQIMRVAGMVCWSRKNGPESALEGTRRWILDGIEREP